MPDCLGPDELEDDSIHWAKFADEFEKKSPTSSRKLRPSLRPIEMRSVDPVNFFNPTPRAAEQLIWIKANGIVDDINGRVDKPLHHAILAYASDFSLMSTSLLPHGISFMNPKLQPASLDHCIWFHDEFRTDEWLLYAMDSPRANHARGLSRGSFFTRDGRLVASVIQEGLMRLHKSK
jgi:acyl-CoA thioesterase-2